MLTVGNALIISDQNPEQWKEPNVDGAMTRRGLIPRDYNKFPVGCYNTGPGMRAVTMDEISESEWPSRMADLIKGKAQLSDIRARGNNGQRIPSTDQNGKGYCWIHSGTSATLVVRAREGQPYVDLSAYAGACIIKGYRDEGGWGAQGVDFICKRGLPTGEYWPQKSSNPRNDNPETWKNAALHRIHEGWIDLQAAQYDRNLAWRQVGTCLLSGHPVIGDYNWWGHSVCLLDLVAGNRAYEMCRDADTGKKAALNAFEAVWNMNDPVTGGYGVNIWNSWSDAWSNYGEGILPPQKAVPDGSVAVRTTTASIR